jgi:hypothetical protein
MRDVNCGRADTFVQKFDFGAHFIPQARVEMGHRLIEEKYVRVVDEGTTKRDTLLLAAGKLIYIAIKE